jgi:hypothetical protein
VFELRFGYNFFIIWLKLKEEIFFYIFTKGGCIYFNKEVYL